MTMHAPHIEAAPWADQAAQDDAAYRAQVAYLFARSPFYRDRLRDAGFPDAAAVGGLTRIAALPFTEKDDLRATRDEGHPIGTHLAAPIEDIVRIYSTSGTTGTPSYIPLTQSDLDTWVEISQRSYGASGITRGERMVTTYNAGPFVAGVTLDAFARLSWRPSSSSSPPCWAARPPTRSTSPNGRPHAGSTSRHPPSSVSSSRANPGEGSPPSAPG